MSGSKAERGHGQEPRKIPFWASVFTLLAVMVLVALGGWQVQRLAWKQDLIATMEARAAAEYELVEAGALEDEENLYRIVGVEGRFIEGSALRIIPRPRQKADGTAEQGVHIVAAFDLKDGEAAVVNLGWAPQDFDLEAMNLPKSTRAMEGMIRPFPRGNVFSPVNDIERDAWYLPRHMDFETRLGRAVLPVMLQAVDLSGDGIGAYPEALPADIELRNNHAQYAAFWFAMAAALVIIYMLRFIVRKT